MADKSFGIKELNLIGSGTPKMESPNNINLNANNVAISTNATIGGNLDITGNLTVNGTSPTGGLTVQDEGSALSTTATTLNFVGTGVVASGTGATKTITISGGGGGGVTVQDEGSALSTTATTLNFTGGGVVASGTGATKTITISAGSASTEVYIAFIIDGTPGRQYTFST